MIKKIIFTCLILIAVINVNAQENTKQFFQNWLIGTWTGDLKGTTTKALKIVIVTAKFRENSTSTLTGYSTVNGKNKTAFTGTFNIEDGYVDITLNENGNKKTDGIFKLSSQGPPGGMQTGESKVIIGTWKSFDTKIEKTVLIAKTVK
jgi:hypothetical protein